MPQILAKHFVNEQFNSEKFVKELSSECVGAEELRQQRAKIQELANSTSALLKRNVYQNYIQFIETAKEISYLENEMYQLAQLLGEQRSLLSLLGTIGSTNAAFENNSAVVLEKDLDYSSKEESKQKLVKLLENVEGAMSLVETPGRMCIYDGSLLELDPLESTPLKRIHAYLFNDVLMIASWLMNGNKRGPPRYKMQVVYDLQSLAVVNVRDLGTVKLAIKLLAFPDTRIFQCATATSKKEWLEKCEHAKKLKISQENKLESGNGINYNKLERIIFDARSSSSESCTLINEQENEVESYKPFPEWLLEASEDLDSCIAQRHFEDAHYLLEKSNEFFKDIPTTTLVTEMKLRLKNRASSLINVLTTELKSSVEAESLQGGLRSARRAVRLLIQLDRSAQACKLYLHLCSAALKSRIKRIKREGTPVPYIKQLSAIAFSNIVEISREFLKIFLPHTICTSALAVWCSHELKYIVSFLIKQIFIPQVTFSVLVECISTIRSHSEQLIQIGIDFRYQLDEQLRIPISQALQDTAEKFIEAAKIRAIEDTWKPSYFQTIQSLDKLLSELNDLGIPLPESYIRNEHWIPLTSNTLIFSKLFMMLLEDCLNITTSELINVIEDVLISVLEVHVNHLQTSLMTLKHKHENKIFQDNIKYFHDIIIIRSLELHNSVTGYEFSKLVNLQEKLRFVSTPSIKPKPAPRTSVTKYSTTEYI